MANWVSRLERAAEGPEREAEREALRLACEEDAALSESAAGDLEVRRRKAQEQFTAAALTGIEDAIKLGGRRIRRALAQERELDAVLELLEKEELGAKERGELVRKVKELQIYSIRDLTGFINAVYDKVELSEKEHAHAFEVRLQGETEEYAE